MERNDRFCWTEENPPTLITNDTIQCADCRFRTDPAVMECEKYLRKPDKVLDREAPCKHYQKKA